MPQSDKADVKPAAKKPRRRSKSYPGNITRRGSGSWKIRLCVDGKYHHYTVHGTKVEAENYATTKYDELTEELDRKREGRPGPVRFSKLLDDFEKLALPDLSPGAQRSYGDSFKVFRTYFVEQFHDPVVRKVRRADIRRFLAWRRTYRVGGGDGGVSKYTVARDLRVLKLLMNYAVDLDYIDNNPAHRVKAPKPDERSAPILTDDQYEALLDAAKQNPMLHTYITLLGETGARAYSEALTLEWADLDLQRGFLLIRNAPGRRTKSGKSRWVPMTARLRETLQEHAARFRLAVYGGKRSPYVFHHPLTVRRCVAGERIKTMRAAFTTAAKRAKVPEGFRPHDLRHRRVTTWLANSKSAVMVKEAVGHADLATTMRYTHLLPEHLRELVEDPTTVKPPERAHTTG